MLKISVYLSNSNCRTFHRNSIQIIPRICTTFKIYGLPVSDQRKAQAIYIDKLMGLESQDGFFDLLAECFVNTDESMSVYTLISVAFLVSFSDEEIAKFDELYGVSTGLAEETTTTS